ncbi:phosphoribosyl-AMP cyclohydrolase [Clostridium neuense]|uniref:Phosphoribosyl-AMP cyclohydrolase n=1 Tax=Clostridium neuense TaxID=1728934 RepID=A0ABW8TFB6_9CLOT
MKVDDIIDIVDFSKGLVPAIVQDLESSEVLMLAYMDKKALEKTIETGTSWFWSRSRKSYWNKGETSGHFQYVEEIGVDCDGDTILLKVRQIGAACHTGNKSCFYRKYDFIRRGNND